MYSVFVPSEVDPSESRLKARNAARPARRLASFGQQPTREAKHTCSAHNTV